MEWKKIPRCFLPFCRETERRTESGCPGLRTGRNGQDGDVGGTGAVAEKQI